MAALICALWRPAVARLGGRPRLRVGSSSAPTSGGRGNLAGGGFGLYLPIGLLYLISGLVVPLYGVALLLTAWALLLIVLFRLLATRPAWALLIPALAVALWVGVLAFGGSVLNWTA